MSKSCLPLIFLSVRMVKPFSINFLASETIQTDEVITLSEKDSEIFMGEIENPKEPNDIIKNAIEKYKQSRGENTIINQPYTQSKTNIKRID